MKIKKITLDAIIFDNDSKITFDHEQDCCEYNYADFMQLEETAMNCKFPEDLIFEKVVKYGFRFGGIGTPMFFIPCYSVQNGWYTTEIDIYFDDKKVISTQCKLEDV